MYLIDEILEQIKAHPERHRQESWRVEVDTEEFCGTAFCFAGWSIELDPCADWGPAPEHEGCRDGNGNWFMPSVDGKDVSASQAGVSLLLAGVDASRCWCHGGGRPMPDLFHSEHTLEDIERIVEEMRQDKYFLCEDCNEMVRFTGFRKKGDPIGPPRTEESQG